ncbi:MAG: hypothetical protein KDA91_02690 [Planctomycetaceae bacterium]|nr:hypothetical protein [Planctomycetaceae bacterium]
MKFVRAAKSAITLSVASTLTAGSMFATVQSAASQDAVPVLAESASPAPQEVLHDRSHDVVLHSEGRVVGRLSRFSPVDGQLIAAQGCTVTLVKDGRRVTSALSDDAGVFSVQGLEPGVYGLIATGTTGYALYSFRAVAGPEPGDAVADNAASPVSLDLQINTVSVLPRDFPTVRDLIERRYANTAARESVIASRVPTVPGADHSFGSGPESTPLNGHQVQLRSNGDLVGEVNLLETTDGYLRPVRDITVYFVMDNTIIGSTAVNADGSFRLVGLTPGFYSVVGVGDDGVLAVGVDVLGPAANDSEYKPAFVSQTLDLAGAAVDPLNFIIDAPTNPESPTGDPTAMTPGAFPGGAAPGGLGGGGLGGGAGGGLGGGGGLGTLLGAAIAGGVGYAIADNNGNNDASPSN